MNDLPGCLAEVNRVLKTDGVFLASMFGSETLFELRSALVLAELEREGVNFFNFLLAILDMILVSYNVYTV